MVRPKLFSYFLNIGHESDKLDVIKYVHVPIVFYLYM